MPTGRGSAKTHAATMRRHARCGAYRRRATPRRWDARAPKITGWPGVPAESTGKATSTSPPSMASVRSIVAPVMLGMSPSRTPNGLSRSIDDSARCSECAIPRAGSPLMAMHAPGATRAASSAKCGGTTIMARRCPSASARRARGERSPRGVTVLSNPMRRDSPAARTTYTGFLTKSGRRRHGAISVSWADNAIHVPFCLAYTSVYRSRASPAKSTVCSEGFIVNIPRKPPNQYERLSRSSPNSMNNSSKLLVRIRAMRC